MPVCCPAAEDNNKCFEAISMQKKRARAIAIATTRDAERLARLRFLAITIGAVAALLALPVLF